MIQIAKNDYYELNVDKEKNRMYLKIIGFWTSKEVVPEYLLDIEKATKSVTRGFTIVSDLRGMNTPPKAIGALHEQAQRYLVLAGLDKTAEIVSSAILKLATKKYATTSQMAKKEFDNLSDAEKWLDS